MFIFHHLPLRCLHIKLLHGLHAATVHTPLMMCTRWTALYKGSECVSLCVLGFLHLNNVPSLVRNGNSSP